MKKLPIIATLLLLFICFTGFSQKNLKEGKLIYTISYPDMDLDPQQAAMLPSVMTLYVKGNHTRMEMNMGMGMKNVTITDSKNKTVTSLIDAMGQKYAMKMTEEEMKKQVKDMPKPDIEKTGETKEIAGFKCEIIKVTQQDEKGNKMTMDVCLSKDFIIPNANWSNPAYKDIEGLMLEYEMNMSQLNMKMTLKSLKEEAVADSMFEIPEGYEMKTLEELQNMK